MMYNTSQLEIETRATKSLITIHLFATIINILIINSYICGANRLSLITLFLSSF
jgi:hypothetical protein